MSTTNPHPSLRRSPGGGSRLTCTKLILLNPKSQCLDTHKIINRMHNTFIPNDTRYERSKTLQACVIPLKPQQQPN